MSRTIDLPSSQTVTRRVLDNGIKVLVYEIPHVHSVFIAGSLHAGGIYVPPERAGLAAMTASCLMLGTRTRGFDSIHDELENVGADLGLHAGGHKVGFSGKALAEDLDILIRILADVLRDPVFPEEYVERRRGEILTWLQYREQDTRWLSANSFRRSLYPQSHPYHVSVRGTPQTVSALKRDQLVTFHQTHYGPRDMAIVIVGAVNANNAIDMVADHLGDWRNDEQPDVPDLPNVMPPTETMRANTTVPGKAQADIVCGTIGPSRYAPDFQAANLANSILGQFGMMGRIGQRIREEAGLAYYAFSKLEGGYGPGAWSVSIGVDPKHVDEAINMALHEIRRLITEPVSDDDLADNQSYFVGRLPLQLESSEGVAGALLTIENFNLGLDYLSGYGDMIRRLSRDKILSAARRYLNPDALVISVAGPEM